ncbi:quinone-dependent dihydroorotate dehydrogenase [Nakamurella flavida]|uniref:Dihydroorotate dehydrogenase (quinone) n=2 Tax=Nakamurella flavida TaxID=363630 RepID=A0A939C693_9ACTN|nr:quinone-dependent dihydroorotate dehydrogenase [Nakamurella flavida]MBM9476972.1 quinone-dependent dihydroorotate dehydrogenase [Nakamurella flavida]MDP9779917.1 dihydroorotate dehydrogenase [Nakamurella flavida]
MSEQMLYRALSRAVLFRLGGGDPERAHHLTMAALARIGRVAPARRTLARLLDTPAPRRVFGLDFPSPVGLAAGMDKNAVAVQAWPALGFGFVEVGTVTAHAQHGNPQPRLFRLRTSEAIVNRMGFNNEGAAALATTLAAAGPVGVPIGVSLGKSKITPVAEAVEDYLTSLRLVHPYADYLAINVSSPNTPGLRSLQDRAPLDELLGAMTAEAAALAPSRPDGRPVPVLVKIAPDLTDHAVAEVLEVCQDRGVAGVIATNTTLDRSGVSTTELGMAAEVGGLSGRPLRRRALGVVRFVTSHSDLPVIGVGGISDVDAALAMLDAGASLLQLYTGFIFGGPGLVRDINRAVAARDAGEN